MFIKYTHSHIYMCNNNMADGSYNNVLRIVIYDGQNVIYIIHY